jgi:hypothetical protein
VTLASPPDGKTAVVNLVADQGKRRAKLSAFNVAMPGVYTLKIATEVAGKPLTAEHRFEVVSRDLESLDVLANPATLRRLSAETKGEFRNLDDFADLLRHLQPAVKPKTVTAVVPLDLSASYRWPLIWTLIALLALEWSIRKRKALV